MASRLDDRLLFILQRFEQITQSRYSESRYREGASLQRAESHEECYARPVAVPLPN